ncbi:MAG: zinc ribbon domain-containing protein [Anaerolineae bacterium]
MKSKIALDWRLRGPRYRMEAVQCPHCKTVHFPPRDVCLACGQPLNDGQITVVESETRIEAPVPFVRQERRALVVVETP